MPSIGFREKQYETAANIELGFHYPAVFAPDQVIEGILGYDVAAHQPSDSPIWKLLDVKARTGLMLNSNLWQRAKRQPKQADLPSDYVSLIFQYKCPEEITRSNGRQWHFWKANYFRFEIYPHQHEILRKLETSTGNRAVVRYAAPAFSGYKVLQDHQLNRKVLAHSAFVSPVQIGHHAVWTYTEAGNLGRGNPDGDEQRLETAEEVLTRANDSSVRETLLEHLRGVAAAVVSSLFPSRVDLRELLSSLEIDLPEERQVGVQNVLQISNAIAESGATWFVVDRS